MLNYEQLKITFSPKLTLPNLLYFAMRCSE